jgi:hypothetical protein
VSEPATPPLAPLREVLATLDRAELPHAIGASGLLMALGLVDRVNDWDVTVEADVDTLAGLFPGRDFTRHGNSGGHADHKLTFAAEKIELIARFAFFVPGGIVRVPTVVTRTWQGVPIGSPAAWAAAYAIMADQENDARRAARAELLFEWIARSDAPDAGLAAILAEPLPDAIGERLRVSAARSAPSARPR